MSSQARQRSYQQAPRWIQLPWLKSLPQVFVMTNQAVHLTELKTLPHMTLWICASPLVVEHIPVFSLQ